MDTSGDPEHRSVVAKDIFDENGINWWKMPAESPDLNPIENLWYELKEFIQGQVKPSNKEELMDGVRRFEQQLMLKSALGMQVKSAYFYHSPHF